METKMNMFELRPDVEEGATPSPSTLVNKKNDNFRKISRITLHRLIPERYLIISLSNDLMCYSTTHLNGSLQSSPEALDATYPQ